MKVTVERSGGFAGIRRVYGPVDTDDLAPERAAALGELVGAAEAAPPGQPLPDDFGYRVTVEGGAGPERTFATSSAAGAELAAAVSTAVAAGAAAVPPSPPVPASDPEPDPEPGPEPGPEPPPIPGADPA